MVGGRWWAAGVLVVSLAAACGDKTSVEDSGTPPITGPDTPTDTGTVETGTTDTTTEPPPVGPCAILDGVEKATLEDALAEAHEGSVVVPCAGVHIGVFVAAVGIELHGPADAPEVVILDSNGFGSTLTVAPGTTVTDLTVRDGYSDAGGGVALSAAGELHLDGVLVLDNQAEQGGGLWAPPGSTVTLTDTELSGNTGTDGGGLWAGAGATVDLTGSTIRGNFGLLNGGGAYLDGATLIGGTIEGNKVDGGYYGTGTLGLTSSAGLFLTGTGAVTGTVVTGNIGGFVAGVAVQGGDQVLTDVQITANRGADGGVGGLDCEDGSVELVDSEISENDARIGGGYIAYCDVIGGTVRDNTGNSLFAAGFQVYQGSITSTTFEDHDSGSGAVVDLFGGTITDVVFSGNSHAGAPLLRVAANTVVDGCTLTGNTGTYGIEVSGGPAEVFDTTISDAIDPYLGLGAGIRVGWNHDVTVEGGALLASDHGVRLEPFADAAKLELLGVDLGTGATDNGIDIGWSDADYSGYGAATTATCAATCTPAP